MERHVRDREEWSIESHWGAKSGMAWRVELSKLRKFDLSAQRKTITYDFQRVVRICDINGYFPSKMPFCKKVHFT